MDCRSDKNFKGAGTDCSNDDSVTVVLLTLVVMTMFTAACTNCSSADNL